MAGAFRETEIGLDAGRITLALSGIPG